MSTVANTSPTVTGSSEVRTTLPKYMTYMEGRQLQHPGNVNRREYHFDCSSEERTHFQYIQHNSGELDQFLVQKQHYGQQWLLYGEMLHFC